MRSATNLIVWLLEYHIVHRQGIFRIPLVASQLPQTMAGIAVLSSLESAKEKLEQNGFPFAGLPNDRNDSLWTRIEETYGLSLAEVSFLKNASAGTTSKSVMFHCLLISIPTSSMCAVSNPYPN